MKQAINIILDGPPSHELARLIEIETDDGESINMGDWAQREDGYWVLRINELSASPPNQEVATSQEPCVNCHFYTNTYGYHFCPACGLTLDR